MFIVIELEDIFGQKFKEGDYILYPKTNDSGMTKAMNISKVLEIRSQTPKGKKYRNRLGEEIEAGVVVQPIVRKFSKHYPDLKNKDLYLGPVLIRNISKVVKIPKDMVDTILEQQ